MFDKNSNKITDKKEKVAKQKRQQPSWNILIMQDFATKSKKSSNMSTKAIILSH